MVTLALLQHACGSEPAANLKKTLALAGKKWEEFVDALKEKGLNAYNPVKDAAIAREIVGQWKADVDATVPF